MATKVTALERWEAAVASMREGTRLYLSNDFAGAEALFCAGMGSGDGADGSDGAVSAEEADGADDNNPEDDRVEKRDTRGAFALQYAIVGLMRGVASLANDQLDECRARLWEADRLAAFDANWVGRKVVRGTCTLVAGLVQCLQREPVRGVWHIVRSWQWLRHLRTEALEYAGVGREIVRSAALMALGAFALILSLLPPHLIRAASWSTGFEIDRAAGLAMLRTCQSEGGVYAPVAALGWLAFHVDTKTFLGEAQSEDELCESAELLAWASRLYGDSLFFSILQADLHACRRQLPSALAVIDRARQLPVLESLRALSAVLRYKCALYELASLSFGNAASHFAASHAIYVTAGRRSLAPAMAISAAHCHLILGDAAGAEAMMGEVAAYAALDKSNWVPQDRAAFRVLREYEAHRQHGALAQPECMRAWSLLHLGTAMAVFMRCTLWMSDELAGQFSGLLDGAHYPRPDDRARAAMIVAQMHAQRGTVDEGLAVAAAGLSEVGELGEESAAFGTVPMLHYLNAHMLAARPDLHRAEASLQASIAATTRSMVLAHFLSFKAARLRCQMGLQRAEAYERLALPAGKKATLAVTLSRPDATAAEWDWALEARDVDFSARLVPSVGGAPSSVAPRSRYSASDGPVEGKCELPGGVDLAVLELSFSNHFSYVRSKALTYRLSLPAGVPQPIPRID